VIYFSLSTSAYILQRQSQRLPQLAYERFFLFVGRWLLADQQLAIGEKRKDRWRGRKETDELIYVDI